MIDQEKLQQRMTKVAELISRIDSVAESGVRSQVQELLESVMQLHGEAIERILVCIREGAPGSALLDSLIADPVVASVLLLYGLHPLDLETRVRRAIEKVQPVLRSHAADAELIGISAGTVRIRVRRVESAFVARSVKAAIEEELYAAAPDAASLVLLGLEKFAAPDFVPLENIGVASGAVMGAAGRAGD